MTESKQVEKPEDVKESLESTVEDALEGEDVPNTSKAGESSKSKKKKKKSKLKNLLSHKPNAEVSLAEVEEAISSTSAEEKKALSKEEQAKLDMIIKKMNQMLPGGKKDLADHKFWKTQPVLKFGKRSVKELELIVDEIVSEEGPIESPQPDLVRKEPLSVAGDFEFVEMDMNNDTEVTDLSMVLMIRYKKSMNYYLVTTSKMRMRPSDSHTLPHSSNGNFTIASLLIVGHYLHRTTRRHGTLVSERHITINANCALSSLASQ